MSEESLYDALLVDQNATFDEIKLAFKRRALQVHPDKGGSKEAFHLVYQALEILADPEARKKYDSSLGLATGKPGGAPGAKHSGYGRKKNVSRRQGQATAPMRAHSSRTEKSASSKQRTHRGRGFEQTVPQSQQSKQIKLLTKVRDLLKQLPRDMRNDVIRNDFSQKQRLILEEWMANQSGAQADQIKTLKLKRPSEDDNCKRGSVPAVIANLGQRISKKQIDNQNGKKARRKPDTGGQSRGGYVHKKGNGVLVYEAGICFDSVEILTRLCDLQTGLEYLVVLTEVKQKMRDATCTEVSFEERLQSALASSAIEHGKDLADMRLSFGLVQAAAFFIGTDLRTPRVRNFEKFGSIRRRLEPFRQYAQKKGAVNIYWQYSPAHLQDALERFRSAVVDAWEIAGVDSTSILNKITASHEARAESRQVRLLQWERGHMAMQDKNKHRPRWLRERNRHTYTRLEQRERRQMAMEDKNRHRPRKLKVQLGLQRNKVSSSRKSMVLKRLLARWEKLLQREARVVDKERQKVLRQRKAQRKKDQEERRRLELLHKKRLREKEKQRREALCKRMRSDLTMDEILGDRAGAGEEN
eukprot:Skav211930  [mRNA]  locus=scaffold1086:286520:288274:+ [translate_table: standard]